MLKITWYGTAMMKFDINGEKILLDPFIRRNRNLRKPNIKDIYDVNIILNTHPHLDHLYDAAKILNHSQAVIYGSVQMRDTLKTLGIDSSKRVKVIHPYDRVDTRESTILVYPSKHGSNDLSWKSDIAKDCLSHMYFKSLSKIYRLNKKFPMGDDIFGYKINTGDFNIFALGSAGIGENVHFEDNIDIFILPYQGRTDMAEFAFSLVERVNPKLVILDHFDDALPPVTRAMDAQKFIRLIRRNRREIKVVIPQMGKTLEF